MGAIRSQKERSIKDMLSKQKAGKTEANDPGTGKHREEEMDEDTGASVTRSFLAGLFTSLWGDIQEMKRDLSQDLKVVCRELEGVGERVVTLEEHENTRGEEIEQLQQEILQLQDQQSKLQVHTGALMHRSRRNNICIRGAPTRAKEEEITICVQVLFYQILGESSEKEVCIDSVHRVGPLRASLRASHIPPADNGLYSQLPPEGTHTPDGEEATSPEIPGSHTDPISGLGCHYSPETERLLTNHFSP
ncbi:hypothetical protein NDU88_004225 [Pleurodeles waltl]|uniref:Uncharacterized protein n=1 Tax=Pleurodeles waltl TaxID=8319 RepID=A0AAV7TRV2_PLEWA|nr:hypothetical protein NDU88_004225 [Pleurodeles waltl]